MSRDLGKSKDHSKTRDINQSGSADNSSVRFASIDLQGISTITDLVNLLNDRQQLVQPQGDIVADVDSTTIQLENLPAEITRRIVSWLPLGDYLCLAHTNLFFHATAFNFLKMDVGRSHSEFKLKATIDFLARVPTVKEVKATAEYALSQSSMGSTSADHAVTLRKLVDPRHTLTPEAARMVTDARVLSATQNSQRRMHDTQMLRIAGLLLVPFIGFVLVGMVCLVHHQQSGSPIKPYHLGVLAISTLAIALYFRSRIENAEPHLSLLVLETAQQQEQLSNSTQVFSATLQRGFYRAPAGISPKTEIHNPNGAGSALGGPASTHQAIVSNQ